MGTLSVLLAIVSVITALLLTIVILIQNPKGQGGIGSISGGVSEAMFGASAPSALVKITVVLAVIFLLSTLFYAAIVGHQREAKSLGESITGDFAATGIEALENTAAAAAEETVDAAGAAVENAAETAEKAVESAAEAVAQ
ncbi:MAG: preprotein translocase subunit SecG [Victivallales bacterium]|nr:preprotein translocase subunit SecG [Victivallales bacterium]